MTEPYLYKGVIRTPSMKVIGEKLTKIDYITLGFIAFQTIILILNWNYLPTSELDTPYHLLMGKMFADYDTVMLWDYYEYAPVGRPHLYPPLEHILLWWMHDLTGTDWWNIGRFVSLIQYPLPMLMVWFFCKKLFNPVTALASVIFLSVSFEFWFWQVSVAPTALILSLFPLFLYCFYRKKVLASIVLLTSFLYLHLGLPYVVILCVFIFALFSLFKTREYMKLFAIVTGVSTLLFLPWIIHIFMYRDWLRLGAHRFFDPSSLLVGINILTAIFIIIGFLTCVEKSRIDLKYLLILSAFIGFFAVAIYGNRYKMHSPIINCIVTGIGFEAVYTRILIRTSPASRKKVAAGILLLLIPLGAISVSLLPSMFQQPQKQPQQQFQNQPQMPFQQQLQPAQPQFPPSNQLPQQPQLPQNQLPQQPNQPFQQLNQPAQQPLRPGENRVFTLQLSPLLEMLKSLKAGARPPRVWQINNPEIDELIQWIINNTSEDEILHVEQGMLADYIALFTNRRTDSGMYREVTQPELIKSVREGEKSGILILEAERFKEQLLPQGMTLLEQFGNLLVIQGMKPEHIPREKPFHLTDLFILLERPDPDITTRWVNIVTQVNPRQVYIGVRQKDLQAPELQYLIDELHAQGRKIGLGIVVEDTSVLNIQLPSHITSLRLILPQEKISPEFVESVRNTIDPQISLEIAILGHPITENRSVAESLSKTLPFVDRVVRHVPPNVEFIHITKQEQQLLGSKFFIQIDTYRGESELTPEELYMLLQTAYQIVGDKIIIEFRYPPRTSELLNFLRDVYAV